MNSRMSFEKFCSITSLARISEQLVDRAGKSACAFPCTVLERAREAGIPMI